MRTRYGNTANPTPSGDDEKFGMKIVPSELRDRLLEIADRS